MDQDKSIYSRVRMRSLLVSSGVAILLTVFLGDFKVYSVGVILGTLGGIISLNMVIKMADNLMTDSSGNRARLNYYIRLFIIGIIFGIAVYLGVNVFTLLGGYLITRMMIYLESIKIKK